MVSKKEIQNFYDDYRPGEYAGHTTALEHEGRLLAILSLLDLKEAEHILDIGCGVGWLTRQYAKSTRGHVTGIDLAPQSINEAKAKAIEKGLDNLSFEAMDAEELIFGNETFDYIICSEVLEHLLDPEKALREMRRVIKPTGYIVITTPNSWHYNGIYKTIFEKLGKQVTVQVVDRWISPLGLNRMARNAGLKIIKRKGAYYLPPFVSSRSRLYSTFIRISRIIERWNLLPYMGLYQVCLLHPASLTADSKVSNQA